MKPSISAVALIGAALAFGSGNSFAKDSGGHRSSSSSSTPSAPRISHASGTTHFSGPTSYQPRMNFSNGSRTLNYPAVRNSVISQQTYSNHRNLAAASGLQGNANPVLRKRSSTLNGLNNAYALQHSENFRQSHNFPKTPGLRPNPGNKLDPQTSAHLRNWNGNVSTTQQAHLNHLNNCHHHHDHWWWRHHCASIIFFDFGWWGWYDGWWYPAWGYDLYSYYDYNEPIYGYDGLSPEQVVASVQVALQERGYYQYAVDGRMGPLTRAAIARFQSDHRLPITSGIDPATLGTLGIIR